MHFTTNKSDPKDIIEKVEVAEEKFAWVQSAVHIGNTLHEDGTMEQDVKVKRAQFVDSCHNLQEEFYKSHPEVQAKLLSLYNSSCYGSNTWNLYGTWANKFFTSWNVSLKYIWDLPHATHRYFYEHLTECRHLKILLIRRFLNFVYSIAEGRNELCKFLLNMTYRNVKSVTGSNIKNIEHEVGERIAIGDLRKSMRKVCKKIEFEKVPETEVWRISALKEAALLKTGHMKLEGFSSEEIEVILQFICVQ